MAKVSFYEVIDGPRQLSTQEILYRKRHGPPMEDGEDKFTIVNEAGEDVPKFHFIWFKDPDVPYVQIANGHHSYTTGSSSPGYSEGLGHIRMWIDSNVSEDERVYIIHTDGYSVSILFETMATLAAFKMTFSDHRIPWVTLDKLF